MSDAEEKIKRLKETIRLLNEENENLCDRAEDITLLSVISSELYLFNDKKKIIQNILEQLTIAKGLTYACFAKQKSDILKVIYEYNIFSDSPAFESFELTQKGVHFLNNLNSIACNVEDIIRLDESTKFARQLKNKKAILIYEKVLSDGNIFLFLTDDIEQDKIEHLKDLFKQALNIIAMRLENIELVEKLKEKELLLTQQLKTTSDDLERQSFNFERLINSSPDSVFVHEGRFIKYANQATAKLVGVNSPEELIGKNLFEFLHPEDRAVAEERVRKAINGQPQGFREYRMINTKGDMIYIEVAGIPIYDKDRVLIFTTIRNIHERKLIENDLKQSKNFLSKVMNAITNPLYVVDADTYEIVHANKASGIELKDEPVKCYKVTHNLDQPCGSEDHKCPLDLLKSGQTDAMVEHIHYDWKGRKRYVEVHAHPIIDDSGKLSQFIEFTVDVTERREFEEKLNTLQMGLKNLDEVVFVTDTEGFITYANPTFKKVYGFELDETLGKNANLLKSGVHTHEDYEKFWNKLITDGVYQGIFINKRKDGEKIYVETTINRILNVDNEPLGYIAIQRDVTNRIEYENALKFAREKAEAADKLKSEFLAQISHEIRTPLNVLMNYHYLIKEQLSDDVKENLDFAFRAINKAGERIIRTVDLLLNMNELQLGVYNPKIEEFDIGDTILNQLVNEFIPAAEAKGIKLELVKLIEDDNVICDIYSVNQIFSNLIDNAIKYTHKGFVKIVIDKIEEKVAVKISDTGIGIEEKYLPKLFLPFSQEDAGYTRKYEGTGLGLAVAKKFCDLNEIDISIESEKGKGTTVTTIFNKTSL